MDGSYDETLRPARSSIIVLVLGIAITLSSFFSLEVNRWLLAALHVIAFGGLFFALRLTSARRGLDLLDFAIMVFLLGGVASVFVSGSRYETLTQWNWIVLYALAFWLARRTAWSTGRLRFLEWSGFLTIVLFAAIGLAMWVQTPTRLTGLLLNANAAGPFLLVGIPLGLTLLAANLGWRRGLAAAGTTLMLFAFLLTASYTAWVAAGIAAVLAGIVFRRSLLTVRVGGAVAATVVGAIMLVLFVPRLLASPGTGGAAYPVISAAHVESSFSQRLEFNRVAIEEFLHRPILGVGLGQYQSVYPRYAATINEQPRYAHNYFLQMFAETGVVGGLALAFVVGFILWRAWQVIRRKDPGGRPLVGFSFAVIALVLAAAVDFSWQFPAVALTFWILAGVLTGRQSAVSSQLSAVETEANHELAPPKAGQANSRTRPARGGASQRARTFFLTILAIIFLVRGLTLAYSQMEFDKAQIAQPKGDFGAAVAAYDRGVRFDPDPVALRERAWLQLLVDLPKKNFERTERAVVDLLRGNGGDYFSHHVVGRIRFVQDRYDEAEREYRRALELDPHFHPDFAYDLGFLYLKQGRLDEARRMAAGMLGQYVTATFSSNPRLETQLAGLEYLLGEVAFAEGSYANAVEHFSAALARDANFVPASTRLGDAQRRVDAMPSQSVE